MREIAPLLLALCLAGCAGAPPENPANACSIFKEKEDWYAAARKAKQRWGVPISVQMAIINQESSFVEDARPPRNRFLGFIPLGRPTTAYGYGQAIDGTWAWYQEKTGKDDAERDEFEDVVDFIGWYTDQSRRRFGISKGDAYRQYLAYHEGHHGYQRGTYATKARLLRAARQVESSAAAYRRQLSRCRAELEQALAYGD